MECGVRNDGGWLESGPLKHGECGFNAEIAEVTEKSRGFIVLEYWRWKNTPLLTIWHFSAKMRQICVCHLGDFLDQFCSGRESCLVLTHDA